MATLHEWTRDYTMSRYFFRFWELKSLLLWHNIVLVWFREKFKLKYFAIKHYWLVLVNQFFVESLILEANDGLSLFYLHVEISDVVVIFNYLLFIIVKLIKVDNIILLLIITDFIWKQLWFNIAYISIIFFNLILITLKK